MRAFAASVIAILALSSTGLNTAPFDADGAGAAAVPAPITAVVPTADQDSGVSISLLSAEPAIVRPGAQLTVRVRVANLGLRAVDDLQVALGIGWRRLATRAALADWADEEAERLAPTKTTVDVPPLNPGANDIVELTIPVDALGLDGAESGPRELSLALTDAEGNVLDAIRTFTSWDPQASPAPIPAERQLALAIVAPLTGPAWWPEQLADALDLTELQELTRPGGRLESVLEAATTAEHATGARGTLTLAIDPALVAIAVGAGDPQLAAWAAQVSGLGGVTEVRPLPPYDPDLSALAHADLSNSERAAALSAPTAGIWQVPENWLDPVAWTADDTSADQATADLAMRGDFDVLIAAELADTEGSGDRPTVAELSDGDHSIIGVFGDRAIEETLTAGTDPELAVELGFDQAGSVGHLISSPEALHRLLAETSLLQSSAAVTEVAAVLPRQWRPDQGSLDLILRGLAQSGWIRFLSLSDLIALADPQPAEDLLPADVSAPGRLPAAAVEQLQAGRDGVARLAGVSEDPNAILAEVSPALVAPLSQAWRIRALTEGDTVRDVAVSSALTIADAETTKLSATPSAVTLISDAGDLPVVLTNELPVPATVYVVLTSADQRLIVDDQPQVTLPPHSSQIVYVPVRAIASGDVGVSVELQTPDGTPVGQPSDFSLRVRAGWENVGTAVAAGGLALMLIAGIWRTVRRGRSPRRTKVVELQDPPIYPSRRTRRLTPESSE